MVKQKNSEEEANALHANSKYQHKTNSMFGEATCLVADGWVTREQSAPYKGIASGNRD